MEKCYHDARIKVVVFRKSNGTGDQLEKDGYVKKRKMTVFSIIKKIGG